MNKIFLFLSSYIPLYVLLILKNIFERITINGKFINIIDKFNTATFFDEINDWAIFVLLVTTLISHFYLKKVLKNSGDNKAYIVKKVSDETGNIYFSYISIYLLSCMGLTLNSITDCFVFIFVMFVVGIIYIKNDMMYMNPIINLMGYKVLICELEPKNTNDNVISSIVVAYIKKNICVESEIRGSGKKGFIVLKKEASN